nr:hypothetical protein [uncultured Acetatifactor sp.]
MDSLSGMDIRLNETKGFGEAQQEGYANIGESFGGDFFSDMQTIEYNPFEEEDEGRETYPDDVRLEGTEEYLPAMHGFRMCFREKKASRWKRPEDSMPAGRIPENWKMRKKEMNRKNQKIWKN